MQVIFSLKNPSDEKEGEMMNWNHKIGCDTTENNKMLNFHNNSQETCSYIIYHGGINFKRLDISCKS